MSVWIPTAAATFELIFSPFTAVAVVYTLRHSTLKTSEKRLLVAAMVFSVLTKICLASLGHNYDVYAYRSVSDILNRGRSVYADSDRYNYAPIWAWLVSGFGHLAPGASDETFIRGQLAATNGEYFHLWVAGFLATIDVLIALLIAVSYSWIGAMVFLLAPIGLLISGFHSQFDNVALLMGLLAWLQVRKGKSTPVALTLSSACLGISLMVKHILFLFPIWLLFWRPLGRLRYRVVYVAVAYGMFFASFLPWWGDPASRAGIMANVFGYKSSYGQSLLAYLVELILPVASLDRLLSWVPVMSGFQAAWMVLMVGMGLALAWKSAQDLYLFYILLVFASTPSIAIQYCAIALVAAAVFYSDWESWAFLAAATLANLTTKNNIGLFFFRAVLPSTVVIHGHVYYNFSDLFQNSALMFFLVASQACAGALLLKRWRQLGKPAVARSMRADVWKAAVLIVAGGIPAVVALARSAAAYAAEPR
jgi:hypothetical protein